MCFFQYAIMTTAEQEQPPSWMQLTPRAPATEQPEASLQPARSSTLSNDEPDLPLRPEPADAAGSCVENEIHA